MLRVFVLVQFAVIQPLSHKIDLKTELRSDLVQIRLPNQAAKQLLG